MEGEAWFCCSPPTWKALKNLYCSLSPTSEWVRELGQQPRLQRGVPGQVDATKIRVRGGRALRIVSQDSDGGSWQPPEVTLKGTPFLPSPRSTARPALVCLGALAQMSRSLWTPCWSGSPATPEKAKVHPGTLKGLCLLHNLSHVWLPKRPGALGVGGDHQHLTCWVSPRGASVPHSASVFLQRG